MIRLALFDYFSAHLGGHDDGVTYLVHDVRYCPDVVIVAVGDDHASNFVLILLEVRRVGNNVIDAGHAFFRELQARVDNEDVVLVFEEHHVLPDLFKTAERRKTEDGFTALVG